VGGEGQLKRCQSLPPTPVLRAQGTGVLVLAHHDMLGAEQESGPLGCFWNISSEGSNAASTGPQKLERQWERGSEGERERDRERDTETQRDGVCETDTQTLCVYMYVTETETERD
jgi:hypothetical protein